MAESEQRLRVLVLCGSSPRHLYVANALCQAADVLAIVQESGSEFSWKKLARTLRPDNFFRKAWRWLRDRRRYTGHGEARFFFGDATAPVSTAPIWSRRCRTSTTRTRSNWRRN